MCWLITAWARATRAPIADDRSDAINKQRGGNFKEWSEKEEEEEEDDDEDDD